MTRPHFDLREPERLPRCAEVLNVFNNALIVLALALLLIVAGAALARIGG